MTEDGLVSMESSSVMVLVIAMFFFPDSTLSCDYALSQCIKSADLVTSSYQDSLVAMTTQQPVGVSA